jgi:succinate-semialdehyde dehydrogenase/glutarate-semialdehyde dehydrogenase
VTQEPVGIVRRLHAVELPTLTPARKIGGALAAGCSLILKASEETPGQLRRIGALLRDAGLPAGVLNLVFGVPADVSEHLIASDAVRKVSFTGSMPVGKHLAGARGQGHEARHHGARRAFAGVVFADADPEKTADTIGAFNIATPARSASRRPASMCRSRSTTASSSASPSSPTPSSSATGSSKASPWGPLANARRLEAMEAIVQDAKSRGGKDRHRRQAARQPGLSSSSPPW